MYILIASILGFTLWGTLRKKWPKLPWWAAAVAIVPFMAVAVFKMG